MKLLAAALTAQKNGLSVVPVKEDGSKSPDLDKWAPWQKKAAAPSTLKRWFSNGRTGMGIVTGDVYGRTDNVRLECLEFDSHDTWDQYKAAAGRCGLSGTLYRIMQGYFERSPNGKHLMFYCEEVGGNTKLAQGADNKTLIETRGRGGMIITAPSHGGVNPAGDYVMESGGFDSIATVTPEEREQLFDLARSFNETVKKEFKPSTPGASEHLPGKDYDARTTWSEILEEQGWTEAYSHGGVTYWRRPGKDAPGISASTNHNDSDNLHIFTTSTELEPGNYSRFGFYAWTHHGGDFKAAASALAVDGYGSTDHAWRDPEPLPDARPLVPEFNLKLLPASVRSWIEDISERIQCAPDYAAVGVMVALSSVIGRQVGIHPKRHDDWMVVSNLWGGIVGRPGIMKTPALQEALRPLRRLEAEAYQEHKEALQEHEMQTILNEARLKALTSQLATASKKALADHTDTVSEMQQLKEQDPPTCDRYETNDSTVEKLGELLEQNPTGILVFRDELTGWLRTLDKQGHESSRAFYLEAWGGTGSFTFDRIGRGTTRIDAASVSLLGGIQPGPLSQHVREAGKSGAGADGLLQRFQMLVYPDEPATWNNVDRQPDAVARERAFSTFRHLVSLDAQKIGADMTGDIPALRFSEPAQEIFTAWRTELEHEKLRGDEPEVIEAHLSKYRSLVPSIALICHLADGGTGPVTETAMAQAAAWAEYLEAHARRIYALALDNTIALNALAQRIQSGAIASGFKPRDVYRHHWKHLDKTATWQAVESLESLGWLTTERVDTGGAPTTVCHINPKVLS